MTNAETVYGSTKNLYVATQRWLPADADPTSITKQTTLIHKFDVSDSESTTYRASGAVPGHLLSQWGMSERGENLLAAGRCLSAEHEAVASARVTAQCFSYGHAVGHAVSLAIKERISPRAVPGTAVREAVDRDGGRLS
jgi:hypothetical protein